jgi:hypothetical protein
MTIFLVAANSEDIDVPRPYAARSALFWNETSSWGTVYLSPFQRVVRWRFGTGVVQDLDELAYVRPKSLGNGFSTTALRRSGSKSGIEELYVNGTQVHTVGGRTAPVASTRSVANIGRGYNDNSYFPGDIAEIVVYTRALSDVELGIVQNYLDTKYVYLPSPWLARDIGKIGAPGGAYHDSGTYYVWGSGDDIGGTADAFHYVYQPLMGDGWIFAQVSWVEDTHPLAKAGVMIRETLEAGSRHAAVVVTPQQGTQFLGRETVDGKTTVTTLKGIAAPYGVYLERMGDYFYALGTADYVTWEFLGEAIIPMAATVYLGLAVTSHDNAVLNGSAFDNVITSQDGGGSPGGAPSVRGAAPFGAAVETALVQVLSEISLQPSLPNGPASPAVRGETRPSGCEERLGRFSAPLHLMVLREQELVIPLAIGSGTGYQPARSRPRSILRGTPSRALPRTPLFCALDSASIMGMHLGPRLFSTLASARLALPKEKPLCASTGMALRAPSTSSMPGPWRCSARCSNDWTSPPLSIAICPPIRSSNSPTARCSVSSSQPDSVVPPLWSTSPPGPNRPARISSGISRPTSSTMTAGAAPSTPSSRNATPFWPAWPSRPCASPTCPANDSTSILPPCTSTGPRTPRPHDPTNCPSRPSRPRPTFRPRT